MWEQEGRTVTYPTTFSNLDPYNNPLPRFSRGQKIAMGVGASAVVGLGVFLLWPSKASAAVPSTTPTNGGGTPKKPTNRPAGQPPGGNCNKPSQNYDSAYWDEGGEDLARQRIFDHFTELGYQTPAGRNTMNDLGPDGELAGDDDIPNEEVRRFQKEYNAVSRWGGFRSGMGGLDRDGMVGPCTVNGMKYVLDNLGDRNWQSLVTAAKQDGYKAS